MTKRNTTADEAIALLLALWQLARANRRADLGLLAGRLGWGVGRVVRVLGHLDTKGLVDREACRLSLSGLAIATSLATASARRSATRPAARRSSALSA